MVTSKILVPNEFSLTTLSICAHKAEAKIYTLIGLKIIERDNLREDFCHVAQAINFFFFCSSEK